MQGLHQDTQLLAQIAPDQHWAQPDGKLKGMKVLDDLCLPTHSSPWRSALVHSLFCSLIMSFTKKRDQPNLHPTPKHSQTEGPDTLKLHQPPPIYVL